MSMIKIENLTFSYPTSYDNVFENVSFQVDTDWKLGFVGRNGRGKTTFLNLLLGKYEYSGKVLSSVQFDYFPYPVSDKNRITEDILQEICPLAEEWELMRELSYLDVDVDVLWRPFETLSNGEQTKVLIAALFLNEGHFLLIDEPTNHLDAKARKSVAAYLKKKKGFIFAFLTIVLTIFYRLTERISKCKEETFHHGCQILSDSKNLNWLRTNVCKRTSDDYSSRQNALQYGLNV